MSPLDKTQFELRDLDYLKVETIRMRENKKRITLGKLVRNVWSDKIQR